jgi:peptidoglycan/LPS O-acetylase OafA/YrhL
MERSASTQPPRIAAGTTDSRDRTIAAVAAVMLVVGMAVAYFSGGASTGEIVAFFVFTGLWLIAIALLVTRLVPSWRASGPQRATRIGLILGVLALIACLVFWTGLPFPLGVGAILLGLWARDSGALEVRRKATGALLLGGFAVVASFVVLLIG